MSAPFLRAYRCKYLSEEEQKSAMESPEVPAEKDSATCEQAEGEQMERRAASACGRLESERVPEVDEDTRTSQHISSTEEAEQAPVDDVEDAASASEAREEREGRGQKRKRDSDASSADEEEAESAKESESNSKEKRLKKTSDNESRAEETLEKSDETEESSKQEKPEDEKSDKSDEPAKPTECPEVTTKTKTTKKASVTPRSTKPSHPLLRPAHMDEEDRKRQQRNQFGNLFSFIGAFRRFQTSARSYNCSVFEVESSARMLNTRPVNKLRPVRGEIWACHRQDASKAFLVRYDLGLRRQGQFFDTFSNCRDVIADESGSGFYVAVDVGWQDAGQSRGVYAYTGSEEGTFEKVIPNDELYNAFARDSTGKARIFCGYYGARARVTRLWKASGGNGANPWRYNEMQLGAHQQAGKAKSLECVDGRLFVVIKNWFFSIACDGSDWKRVDPPRIPHLPPLKTPILHRCDQPGMMLVSSNEGKLLFLFEPSNQRWFTICLPQEIDAVDAACVVQDRLYVACGNKLYKLKDSRC